ncbi:MAG: cell division protein FtsA [Candidatus Omnitrophota bacterium]
MIQRDIIAGLDIGKSKVTLAAARIKNGDIGLIGSRAVQNSGVKDGAVVDLDALTEAILEAREKLEEKNGIKLSSVYVNISGINVKADSVRSQITLSARGSEITEKDVEKLLGTARTVAVPLDRDLIHIFVQDYIVDGQAGVKNPLGLYATKLECNTFAITARHSSVQNITRSVNFAGLEVAALALTSLANSYAVLSEEERQLGVALLDIGSDLTEVSIFRDGKIRFLDIIQYGGEYVTNAIAQNIKVPFEYAEALKIKHGALTNIPDEGPEGRPGEDLHIDWGGLNREVTKLELKRLVNDRFSDFLNVLSGCLNNAEEYAKVRAGIVVLGGGAKTEHLPDRIEESMRTRTRLASLDDEAAGKMDISVTAYGLLKLMALKKNNSGHEGNGGIMGKLFLRARSLLEEYF